MMIRIEPPTHCPTCNSELEWVKDVLYCRNNSCTSRVEKQIEHFAKTLKIKGLGPATINKLQVDTLEELYWLTEQDLAKLLSSEKLAEKLFLELENSKNATLNTLLPGFGIPLIGNSAANKLATFCDNIYDISEYTCREAGLGPKATQNLLAWKAKEFPNLEELPFSFKFESKKEPEYIKGTVCISGRLKSYKTKAEAARILKESGYEVKDSLTKQVTILINESGIESSKTQTARNSGILIVTDLKDLIGENV